MRMQEQMMPPACCREVSSHNKRLFTWRDGGKTPMRSDLRNESQAAIGAAPYGTVSASGNFGQCATGYVAFMASMATQDLQPTDHKGRLRFRIPVSPPNY